MNNPIRSILDGVASFGKGFFYKFQYKRRMVTREMDDIRNALDERLVAKGLRKNEIGLFKKDVARLLDASSEFNLKTIDERLNQLGWRGGYVDYWTIQLIQACSRDE